LFVGALAHSVKWRCWQAESKDQPHTIDTLDQIPRALGGFTGSTRLSVVDGLGFCELGW